MRRHRKTAKPVAEINLTSLLEVTFVLLIAFMIMAPSLKYGVEIDLPGMSQGAPQLTTDQANLATIAITKTMAGEAGQTGPRQFMLDGKEMELGELETRLRERNAALDGKLAVEVNADRDIPYEAFVQVVGALRRAGIEGVGLPVDTAAP
jgi:biopolymer transport protein ExbD